MDFELPGQDDPRRTDLREWIAAHPQPTGRQLAEAGLVAPHWPRPYGLEADPVHQLIIDDELSKAGIRRPANPIGIGWAGPTILYAGTDAQKSTYLPRLLSGEDFWCQLFSEPGSGSDLANLSTRAIRDGDEYIVNGQKIWTSGAQFAKYGILIARTDPDAPKHKGVSYFICPMDLPGIEIRPITEMTGAQTFNEVFFTDAKVPVENLVGEENKGWTCAKFLLAHERTNIADVNRAKRELERLKRIARAEGVWEDARFRDEIALLEVDIVALEMLVLRVLSAEKSGKQSLDIAGLLKIRGSEIQQRYTELMMLAAGPYAVPFLHEAMDAGWQGDSALGGLFPGGAWHCAPLAGTYFNYRKTSIYGGSNEVQRNIVAQTVLGS